MILYKYRDWDDEYHRAVLEKNQLFLAPPSSFNDPFDCQIFAQFVGLTKAELEEYASHIVENNNLTNDQKKFIVDKITKDPQSHQDDFERISKGNFDKHLGIISLAASWSNLLMWSHYGNMHKGFCVGFNEEKLLSEYNFGSSGFVNYPEDNKYPKISPISDGNEQSFFTTVYNKSIEWRYENEYRLAKIQRPKVFANDDRIVSYTDNCISEVILGMNSTENTDREVIRICSEKGIPVYKAYKKQFRFEIERKKLKY